jgi:hypothetical protein
MLKMIDWMTCAIHHVHVHALPMHVHCRLSTMHLNNFFEPKISTRTNFCCNFADYHDHYQLAVVMICAAVVMAISLPILLPVVLTVVKRQQLALPLAYYFRLRWVSYVLLQNENLFQKFVSSTFFDEFLFWTDGTIC